MGDGEGASGGQPGRQRTGDLLRTAREQQGLALDEIANRTRIPLRHLEAIEASSYSELPSATYAMGFAKSYARAVGVDEVAMARELRRELDATYHRPEPKPDLEPREPARLPSRGLAFGGVVFAVLLLIVAAAWYGSSRWSDEAPTAREATAESELGALPGAAPSASPVPAPAAPATGAGQVTLVATGEVWVRVYDAANQTLVLKTLQPGERYDVPMGADNPMINTGRPDLLQVTINGSNVAPLASGVRAIKDVPVSAEALRARGQGGQASSAPTQ